IARDLQTIPISGSTCTTDCVVRVEEVQRGPNALFDTVRLRNQSDTKVTEIVLAGILEADSDYDTVLADPAAWAFGPFPMTMHNSGPIRISLDPGQTAEL